MRVRIKLDRDGIGAVAKSEEMQKVIGDIAEEVADNVRGQGIRVQGEPGDVELPVKVTTSITDRARARVTLAHPAGLAVQAKHGALTKAASEAGLKVKGS